MAVALPPQFRGAPAPATGRPALPLCFQRRSHSAGRAGVR